LAKGQHEFEDVRLGAPAVPPERPTPRGGLLKTLVAVFVGGGLGIGVSLVREANAKVVVNARERALSSRTV
jgi:uncharacterized protein involved in exopolysaccharide biosynthesis